MYDFYSAKGLWLPENYSESVPDEWAHIPEKQWEIAENFHTHYELESSIGGKQDSILGDSNSAFCRFCWRSSEETEIRGTAHVLPELMGKNRNYSFFECHQCNTNLLSNLERCLASWIGNAPRAFWKIDAKRGIPTYDQRDNELKIHQEHDGLHIDMVTTPMEKLINFKENSFEFEATRAPYYPINVYKALSKIGYLMLKEEEVVNFQVMWLWLRSPINAKEFLGWSFQVGYWHFNTSLPIPLPPQAYLYKRKADTTLRLPEKMLVIAFGGMQIQLHLPFGNDDMMQLRTDKKMELLKYPLILPKMYVHVYNSCWFSIENLGGSTLVKDAKQKFVYRGEGLGKFSQKGQS